MTTGDIETSIRRVTVVDGIDSIEEVIFANIGLETLSNVSLVPISIGQSSVTYDVYIVYVLGSTNVTVKLFIKSAITTDGTSIDNLLLHSDDEDTKQVRTAVHKRDTTNGRTIVNMAIVHNINPPE